MIVILAGDDNHGINKKIAEFSDKLDPKWKSCNYHRFCRDNLESAISCALTPAFGSPKKLVVVEDCNFKQLDESTMSSIELLPKIPTQTDLVLVATALDKRLKIVKSLLALGKLIEFNLIPPWRTDEIADSIQTHAISLNLAISTNAARYLAEAIGNDTARIESALKLLATYADGEKLGIRFVSELVLSQNQNSLQLGDAIRQADCTRVLTLLDSLLGRGESPLVICRTLQTQFRTWLWVKAAASSGIQQDAEIAKICHISNPKRVYFLKNDVQATPTKSLKQAVNLLLDLEMVIKLGYSREFVLYRLLEITKLF